jgi:hypothetical protein
VAEDGHGHPGRQGSRVLPDAPFAERGAQGLGEERRLRLLTFAQGRGGGDDAPQRLGESSIALQERHRGAVGPLQRGERAQSFGGIGHGADQGLAQAGLAVEENLALVGEVPIEGALGDARPRGDLRDGDLVEAVLLILLP